MRILILGGSGMLGHKLLQGLRSEFGDVACTVRAPRSSRLSRLPLFAGEHVAWGVEATDWRSVEAVIRSRRPDVVINALGVIKQRETAKDAVPSIQVNALLPHQVAALVAEWGGRLIHFSTDCVFSGQRGRYREEDVPDATDIYGRSKLLGEVTGAGNAITIRTSMIGRELSHHHSLLDWFLAQDGKTVNGYRRVIYSGLTTLELTRITAMLITRFPDLHGLYQVTAPAISKHDLLSLVADAFTVRVDMTPADEPFCDRSLIGERFAAATGYVSPPWPRLIADLAADPTPYPQWLELLNHD